MKRKIIDFILNEGFDFFTVLSFRLFAFWFLVSLLAVFLGYNESDFFSFFDFFGFAFVFYLLLFFPFSRDVYKVFCVCFFVFFVCSCVALFSIVSFIQNFGGI